MSLALETRLGLENRKGVVGVTGAPMSGGSAGSAVTPGCKLGPLMVGDCKGVGNGLGTQISHPSLRTCTVPFIGSMLACARNGSS